MSEVRRRWSARDFAWWCLWEEQEPGEPARSDVRSAIIACTVANAATARGPAHKLEDFIPKWKGHQPPEVVTNVEVLKLKAEMGFAGVKFIKKPKRDKPK